MTVHTLKTRVAKMERRHPNLTPGFHRLTDDEISGLIVVIRQMEAGEPVDPAHDEWALALIQRERLL
ncbi:hypothetical protein MKK63_26085 [Methylobacterium sp. J-088]|uniref:hypothetical protein n=1 Tax=Methylobacterium sp. J-088 TaxID=2836664 RepID=UPI001FBA7B66|nr:hypothetical protein [Methylobacterium sp. J-088]MCJ2066142.1 hypothetical protein [Methylobacterium sp. J-088]